MKASNTVHWTGAFLSHLKNSDKIKVQRIAALNFPRSQSKHYFRPKADFRDMVSLVGKSRLLTSSPLVNQNWRRTHKLLEEYKMKSRKMELVFRVKFLLKMYEAFSEP